jgi:hypothetical protein
MPVIIVLGRLRLGGLLFQISLNKKGCETPISVGKSWVWWFMPIMPDMQEE